MPRMEDEDDEEKVEGVTAHSYGALQNVEAAVDDCWLIRIPPKLAALWQSAPEGTVLGDLVFTKGGKMDDGKNTVVKPSFSVHVSEDLQQQQQEKQTQQQKKRPAVPTANVPLNYSLQAMTKRIPVMHPFTRNPATGSVELMGRVSRTANLQVDQDQSYRALLKDRLVATSLTSNRFVKATEASDSVLTKSKQGGPVGGPNSSSKKSFGNAVYQYGKRIQDASSSTGQGGSDGGPAKKARQFSPDQPIKSVLFELFQQQQYWTVKDIKAAAVAGGATSASTKRAEAEIRDVLREIGDYHRSGDHKNMWELRQEFQQQK